MNVSMTDSLRPKRNSFLENPTAPRAAASRRAVLSILHQSSTWDGADLVHCLREAYAAVAPGDATLEAASLEVLSTKHEVGVRARLSVARTEVIEKLASGRTQFIPIWVMEAMARGHIVHAGPTHSAWRPTAKPHRLADQILALLAVDYLASREQWGEVAVCRACSRVDFNGGDCACAAQARRSTIILSHIPVLSLAPL